MDVRMVTLDPKAIKDLLRMYREAPCLWDQTDLLYMNKEARKEAFQAILKKMKTYHEDITLDIVKRKLENMRATYKREVRRMLAARQRGEDGYRTTLWYFDLMAFIDGGSVTNVQSSRVTDDNDDEENEEDEDQDNEDTHAETEYPYYAEYLEDDPKPKKSRKSHSIVTKKVKQEDTQPNISGVFLTNPEHEEPVLFSENNEAVAFGKALGYQLKEIEGIQRVIAEKLISDVIFNARLNKLTTNSTVQLNSDFTNL
ncbi:uncharacterized protein [Maniola hyperantus]|uniref:uncharacterized protein n=1 Tax=Aphantopus hyperantus TaxID=2795564 RepID=UPI001569D4CC|nr:uncharacterized protein LOC117996545 [Maniola hyperantus]